MDNNYYEDQEKLQEADSLPVGSGGPWFFCDLFTLQSTGWKEIFLRHGFEDKEATRVVQGHLQENSERRVK